MSATTNVDLAIDGKTAAVTFSSESGVNVMSQAALEKLAAVIEQVRQAEQVRWTVLRAEGKVFIAGADIKEMADFDAATAREFSRRGNAVMDALASLPSITVAALHGAALGGGCEIALACDFRIATEKVKIGLPETSLGLIPGWGGTQRSHRLLGPTWARRLVWSATPLSAQQALEIGLVDQVVASNHELESAVMAWCRSFVRGGPRAVAAAKRALLTGDEPTAFGDCFGQDESREGTTAFIQKRAANWMED
ncbi:MAG: crotonase [bacterium]|nr:crotonase [bacterium]